VSVVDAKATTATVLPLARELVAVFPCENAVAVALVVAVRAFIDRSVGVDGFTFAMALAFAIATLVDVAIYSPRGTIDEYSMKSMCECEQNLHCCL
jgi:hypothetical protein